MLLYPRIFFSHLIKNIFPFAAICLLPLLISCGFQKSVIVSSDSSMGEISAKIAGSINENDIFSAVVQMAVMTKDGYYPARAALIIKRPSYLRLELLPIIGVPDLFLAATPEKMSVYVPSRGEFYSGRPTGSNMKKFLPWPIELTDMIMIFTGTYPAFPEKDISYQEYRENNLLRVDMKAPSGCSQTIRIGDRNKLLELVRRDEQGRELYKVKYIYDKHDDAFPEKITIRMADGVTSLSVKYSDVKIEKMTDLSIFDLVMPADVKAISLD
jgi:outer membrane lipoprotein-sorting protein